MHRLCKVQSAQRYFLFIDETKNSTARCFNNLYCILLVNIILHHCHLWWFINHRAIKPPNKSYAHSLHIIDPFYLLMQELFHMLMQHLWSMYHNTLCLISFSINQHPSSLKMGLQNEFGHCWKFRCVTELAIPFYCLPTMTSGWWYTAEKDEFRLLSIFYCKCRFLILSRRSMVQMEICLLSYFTDPV